MYLLPETPFIDGFAWTEKESKENLKLYTIADFKGPYGNNYESILTRLNV
jgi:hypothetical protein